MSLSQLLLHQKDNTLTSQHPNSANQNKCHVHPQTSWKHLYDDDIGSTAETERESRTELKNEDDGKSITTGLSREGNDNQAINTNHYIKYKIKPCYTIHNLIVPKLCNLKEINEMGKWSTFQGKD